MILPFYVSFFRSEKQARTQAFEKADAKFRYFTQGYENLDFQATIRGVNSVSGENLHNSPQLGYAPAHHLCVRA